MKNNELHWVIQENLYKEEAFIDLIQALENSKCKYNVVKVVPFEHSLEPEPKINSNVVVMGATVMIGIALERKWIPGVFYNDNFNHKIWSDKLGNELLNYESEVCAFKNINPKYNPFFIRPCEDRKIFTGQVIDKANLKIWSKSVKSTGNVGYVTLNPDSLVVVSPVKVIHAEWRFFVVDGEVITGSLYKRGDRVIHLPMINKEDSHLYAQSMVDKWQPDRAFVIDVALTDNGYKVIEYNCLNSSGFYKSNVGKIVNSINLMRF